MKVILLKDDKKLGKKDSVIEVKDGYGNFLVRQGTCIIASESNLKKLKRDLQAAKETDEAIRKLANKIKTDLEKDIFIMDVTYNRESQQLNGSITKNDVLEAIKHKYTIYNFESSSFINFPKTKLAQIYKADLRIYKDVIAEVQFGVEL